MGCESTAAKLHGKLRFFQLSPTNYPHLTSRQQRQQPIALPFRILKAETAKQKHLILHITISLGHSCYSWSPRLESQPQPSCPQPFKILDPVSPSPNIKSRDPSHFGPNPASSIYDSVSSPTNPNKTLVIKSQTSIFLTSNSCPALIITLANPGDNHGARTAKSPRTSSKAAKLTWRDAFTVSPSIASTTVPHGPRPSS